LIAHAYHDVMTVRVVRCSTPGPAAARNAGVAASTKPWLQFIDSDCLPKRGFVSGFRSAMDGSVAYAGSVRAGKKGRIPRPAEVMQMKVALFAVAGGLFLAAVTMEKQAASFSGVGLVLAGAVVVAAVLCGCLGRRHVAGRAI
jgi:hypothetical protein